MSKVILFALILCYWSSICDGFTIPNVTLEAYTPRGFRASIPDIENVKLFGFHGNKNKRISQIEPGEFSQDIIAPKVGGWSYYNPDLELKLGDRIYYWIFIQHDSFGYRKDNLVWEVKELLSARKVVDNPCKYSQTEILGPIRVCQKQLIFDSKFSNNTLDEVIWKIGHFIPTYPDYEFCSYQRRSDVIYLKEGKLIVRPIPSTAESEVRGELDLRKGCTSHSELNCYTYDNSGFILPPVVSGKLKTNSNFKYGRIEMKAKLPAGDWLYPEVFLESSTTPEKKIVLAYSRGNEALIGKNDDDIGGKLLFGGPVLKPLEPERSKYLRSIKSQNPYSSDFHTYGIIWEPTKLSFLVDGVQYGEVRTDVASQFNEPMHVVLGVGVGGDTDFPDDYISSGNKKKPWLNYERLQFKKFFHARDDWLPTWKSEGSSLIVEYIKIWAL